MEVTILEGPTVITAQFVGRLDTAASQEVALAVQPLLDKAGKKIVLDCKELSYISSSGLRIFLTIRKAAATKGGEVVVKHMNADIRQVFMMTGFLNMFEIEDD